MTTRTIDNEELKAYGFESRPFPTKRRWFHDDEIFTIKNIKLIGYNNAILTIEEDVNFEIWFSQLTQIYWDKNGNVYSPYLIIKNKKYLLATYDLKNLVTLDDKKIASYINFFEKECKGKKLKAILREKSFYHLFNPRRDRVRIKEIIENFKNKNYDVIRGTCAAGNIFDLEVID